MTPKLVVSVSGLLLFVLAAFFLAPLVLAVYDGSYPAIVAYATSTVVTAFFGGLLRFFGRGAPTTLHRKDAFGIVALIWFSLAVFGGLPFLLEGSIPNVMGAIFEAASGFTTTGATVISDVSGLSRATNLWRCLMHWVGGMGVVVLFVAVFPQLGVGAKQLFKTEVPGPITEGLRPRIKQTALTLWWVYSGMTVICTLLLWWLGMPLYDAICHAFSTLGTGGFSTQTASVGFYKSAPIDWTISTFMLVAGSNFGLYYGAVKGEWRALYKDAELRFYLALNLVVIAIIAFSILPKHSGLIDALRHGTFQVLSVTTTTGFMTEDFDTYPDIARMLLFGCMFIGGCAGSTAGGIKAIRALLLAKLTGRELRTAVQPQAVVAVRIGGRAIPPTVASAVSTFVTTFLGLFVIVSALMVVLGMDLISGMSATIACLASVGPGLGKVGPSQNYAFVPGVGKGLLSFCMIAGRLEIFALLAAFTPECWRR